jgi:hypothetical protein
MNKSSIADELIQVRPNWFMGDSGEDVNRCDLSWDFQTKSF